MSVGQLVVLKGREGVFRIEKILDDGRLRCFSCADGSFCVVDKEEASACPPGARAG